MTIPEKQISVLAEVQNLSKSTEADNSVRLDLDLNIAKYQVINAIAFRGLAEQLQELGGHVWIRATGFMYSPFPMPAEAPGFDPLPRETFCLLNFEVLAGQPSDENLVLLIHDGIGGHRVAPATEILSLTEIRNIA